MALIDYANKLARQKAEGSSSASGGYLTGFASKAKQFKKQDKDAYYAWLEEDRRQTQRYLDAHAKDKEIASFNARYNALLDRYNSEYANGGQWQSASQREQWENTLSRYRSEAASYQSLMRQYEDVYGAEAVKAYDDLWYQLRDMENDAKAANKVYGQYGSEEEYNTARDNAKRFETYKGKSPEEIQADISRMEREGVYYEPIKLNDEQAGQIAAEKQKAWNDADLAYNDALGMYQAGNKTGYYTEEKVAELKAKRDAAEADYYSFIENPYTYQEKRNKYQADIDWLKEYAPQAGYYYGVDQYGYNLAEMKPYEILDITPQSEGEQAWIEDYVENVAAQGGYIGVEDWTQAAEAQRAYDALPEQYSAAVIEVAEAKQLWNSTKSNTDGANYAQLLRDKAAETGLSEQEISGMVNNIMPYLAHESMAQFRKDLAEAAAQNPGLATATTYFLQPLAGIQANTYLLGTKLFGGTPTAANPAMAAYTYNTAIRGQVGKDIASGESGLIAGFIPTPKNEGFGIVRGDTGKWLYDAINSTVDSSVNMLLTRGALGTVGSGLSKAGQKWLGATVSNLVMGSGASAQRFIELKQAGYDDAQVVLGAVTSGLAEGLTEWLGGEFVLGEIKDFDRWLTRAVKSFVAEGTEEVLSAEMQSWYDWYLGQDTAGFARALFGAVAGFKAAGYSDKEAFIRAFSDTMLEYGSSFLAGGFSGMLHFAGGSAVKGAGKAAETYSYAKDVKADSGEMAAVNALVEKQKVNAPKLTAGDNIVRVMKTVKAAANEANYNSTKEALRQTGLMLREEMTKNGGEVSDSLIAAINKTTVAESISKVRELSRDEARLLSLTKAEQRELNSKGGRKVVESLKQVAEDGYSVSDRMSRTAIERSFGFAEALEQIHGEATEAAVEAVNHAYRVGKTFNGAAPTLDVILKDERYAAADRAVVKQAWEAGRDFNKEATVTEDGKIELKGASPAAVAVMNEQYSGIADDDGKAEFHSAAPAAYYTGVYYAGTKYGAAQLEEILAEHGDIKDELRAVYEQGAKEKEAAARTVEERGRIATSPAAPRNDMQVSGSDAQEGQAPQRKRGSVRNISEAEAEAAGVSTVDTSKLTKRQKAEGKILRSLAKQMGFDVVFFDSMRADGTQAGANGWYSNGTIYIDVNAGYVNDTSMLRTTAHELTHFIQQYNAEAYSKLRDFIVDRYYEADRDAFEAEVKRIIDAQKLSEGAAIDEVVADGCQMMLRDSAAPQMLYEHDAKLYDKVSAWVREWANKLSEALKKALAEVAPNSATARALSQTADTMTELQKLWDEALVGAVENKAKSPAVNSEAVQYEVREINGSKFVWIDADILKNKPQGMTDANYIEQYILNKIANEGNFLAQLPESGAKVYAEEKGRTQQSAHGLADEYVKSKYSQWAASNRSQIFKAKMKAAGVLDELVSIAKNRDWQKTRHTDNKDAPYGTYYYDTIFAFPVRDNANEPANRANAYDCKLVILNASDGKKYLYDIVSIKKNTSSTNDISRWLAQKNRATLSTGVSNTTLSQDMQNVKQYSMRSATENDPVEQAEYLEKNGQSRDEIWKATGLVRDARGAWAAEIDDSRMAVYPRGDALLADEAEYQRYMQMASAGEFFDEEYIALAKKYGGRKQGKNRLEEFVKHDELFSRYPQLRDMEIVFRNLGGGERGYFSAAFDAIVLDESLKKPNNARSLSRAAIHEIQHAIQEIDKRAGGSSVEYWQRRIDRGYTRGKNDARIIEADKRYNQLFNAAPDELKSKVRAINRAYLAGESETVEKLVDAVYESEYADAYSEIDIADFQRRLLRESNEQLTAKDLYYDTAGEIEARSTAGRLNMTNEERRNQVPALGWDRAVFADDAQYSMRDPAQMAEDAVVSAEAAANQSNREILANAMETAAQTDLERRKIADYRKKIGLLNEQEQKLERLKSELADAQGDRAKDLRDEIKRTENRINTYDGQLLRLEAAKPLQDVLDREKAALNKKLEEAKAWRKEWRERAATAKAEGSQRLREYRTKRNESDAVKKYRGRVESNVKALIELMVTNTDKKHVPEALKEPIAQFIEALDLTSKQAREGGELTLKDKDYAQRLNALRAAVATYQANAATGEAEGYLDLPDGFFEMLNTNFDTPVYEMGAAELRLLDRALTILKTAISQSNRLMVNKNYARVSEAAEDTIKDLDGLGAAKDLGWLKGINKLFLWNNATPYYAFRRLGPAGETVFESLQSGWDKLALNAQKVVQDSEKIYTTQEVREWGKDVLEIELSGERKVRMTAAQAMSVYCLAKRQQGLGHLLGGGIKISAIDLGKGKQIVQYDNHTLSIEDLQAITGALTERQIQVADKLQDYMGSVGAEWGNEVSMARFGYKAFGEANYFPITSDPNNLNSLNTDAKSSDMFRLLNLSATKSLIKGANNAVVISNVFDVFAAHMADMAKYNALALPILDLVKWYNYKHRVEVKSPSGKKSETKQIVTSTIQKSLEKAFGVDQSGKSYAAEYIKQFIKDLNGVSESGRDLGFISTFMGRYKKAAVAANLRVAVQQPMSYARALAVMDAKYLAKGIAGGVGDAVREMRQYSGIAAWKNMGFFDTNIGRDLTEQIKHDETLGDRISDASMILSEKADEVTWGTLWKACKAEMADKGHSGNELLEKTAERFRQVVYATQVVDATTTRSHLMRSNSPINKMWTAFMSEPTLTYNMMLDSVLQWHYEKRRGNEMPWRTVGKQIKKAGEAYVINAVLLAMATAVLDAWRDDDDFETFWEKYTDALGGNILDELNPVTKIVVLKDVWDILVEGGRSDRMDTAFLTQTKKAYDVVAEWFNVTFKGADPTATTYYGKMGGYGVVYEVFKAIGGLSGMPFAPASREVASLWNNTVGSLYPNLKLKTYNEKPTAGYEKLYEAMVDGDQDEQRSIIDQLHGKGYDDEAITDGVKAVIKGLYLGGDLSDEEAGDQLVAFCGYSATATGSKGVNYQLDKWSIEDFKMAADMEAAFAAGDGAAAKAAVQEQMKRYGRTESQIRGDITSYFKEDYVNGDTADRQRIRSLMLATGLYKAEDLDKQLAGWLKDAK